MRVFFEKIVGEGEEAHFEECSEEEATHIHYCYNDEAIPKPCKREVI